MNVIASAIKMMARYHAGDDSRPLLLPEEIQPWKQQLADEPRRGKRNPVVRAGQQVTDAQKAEHGGGKFYVAEHGFILIKLSRRSTGSSIGRRRGAGVMVPADLRRAR